MYRSEKETLLKICDTMHEIHGTLGTVNDKQELLAACQNGAIKIGESLEKEDKDRYKDTVHKLEDYCETVYMLNDKETVTPEDTAELDDIADDVSDVISSIKPRLKVAFFPYKAEMWDSLESFYLAAREDPECDAFLVPIPYYEYERESREAHVRYDFDRFPKDEDPVPYNTFDHTDGSIDIAYIHNPYDDHNLVTSVHPSYYSRELKKYVRKLIYTPYFVTAGFMADDQLNLPVYENADYIILQSEYAKRSCKGTYYYDRILPFGSSKFDMIINKCNKGVEMPEEWKEILGNRKTLMLNTSINDLLRSNEATISKLEYFFDLIKKNKDLAVIWRPHPLLESTFRSMRPEMLERYEKLKQSFIDEKVGVLDTTPEIANTVAIADGYIGAGASSVINLFGAAGKPVFIFNNTLREPVSREDRRKVPFQMDHFRGKLYLRPMNMNSIFTISLNDPEHELKYEGSIPDVQNWTFSLFGPFLVGDKLYFSPCFAEDAVSYDPVMKKIETLGSVGRRYDVRFSGPSSQMPVRKTVYFTPVNTKFLIMEYIPERKEWIYHQNCLAELHKGIAKPSYMSLLTGWSSWGKYTYCSTGICNRVLKLEQGSEKFEIFYLGKNELDTEMPLIITGASEEGLWFTCGGGETDIYMAPWDALNSRDTWKVYHMPDNMEFTHDDLNDPYGLIGGMYDFGKYMIVFPHRSPHLLKLSKETGEISFIAEDFFKDSDKKGIGYELKFSSIIAGGCPVGRDKYALQLSRDLRTAIIDLNDGSYEEFTPEIPEDVFDKLVPEDAGFFKGDVFDYFRMEESRLFPLENFLEVFAKGGYEKVREEQKKALSSLASNLDGTCGVKTHEYLKQVLEAEDR